ncbi:MAG: hypothetical protein ACE5F8_06430 [Woeseiaceae bacterium]
MNQPISRSAALTGTLLILALVSLAAGCASNSYAAKGAAEGAKTGAIAGAVGGAVTSMIFGGNVVESATRSAVFGASSGAVVGAMTGAKVDATIREEPDVPPADPTNELAAMRDTLGVDAYNAVVALSDCKHEVAIANAREARESAHVDTQLAGLWIEVLSEADRRQEPAARALYPQIVELDPKLQTDTEVEARLRKGMQELGEIRESYGMPVVCTG